MAVITISRKLGSEGDKIADLLCQALGYRRVQTCRLERSQILSPDNQHGHRCAGSRRADHHPGHQAQRRVGV